MSPDTNVREMTADLIAMQEDLHACAGRVVDRRNRRRRRCRVAGASAAVLAVTASTAYATGLLSPSQQDMLQSATSRFAQAFACPGGRTATVDGKGSFRVADSEVKMMTDAVIVKVLHFDDAVTGQRVDIGLNAENAAFVFVNGPNARQIDARLDQGNEQVIDVLRADGWQPGAIFHVTRWSQASPADAPC